MRPPGLADSGQSRPATATDERHLPPGAGQPPLHVESRQTRHHDHHPRPLATNPPTLGQACFAELSQEHIPASPDSGAQMTKPTTIPHVRVEGTSLQRGRQYGTQAAGRVHRSVQEYRQVFAHYAGWDWETVRREAARFEAPIADFRPAYLQEMRGIAEGAGLDLADVLAINVRTEVMYAATARQAPLAARQVPTATRRMQRLRGRPRPVPARCRPRGPELGLAAPRRAHRGRARGPAGRGPGLRHRGGGRAARQDRDERRGPRPGHQRPGDRRGRRCARAALPRAAAGGARLRDRDRRPRRAAGRSPVVLGELPDRPRQRQRARHRGRPR